MTSIAPPSISTTNEKVARSEIRGLTGVRFFAALAVICFHFFHAPAAPWWINRILSAGSLGVLFFFVLSGFILAYNYVHGDAVHVTHAKLKDSRAFWIARFARIYPAYFLALVLQLPVLIATLRHDLPSVGGSLARDFVIITLFTVTLTQNFALVKPIVGDLNPVGWTLSVEAFFYALFPWLGRAFAPTGVRMSIAIIAASLAWIAFVPAWLIPHLPVNGTFLGITGPLNWDSHPVLLLPIFLAGMAICRLFLAVRAVPILIRLAPACCALLVLLMGVGLAANVHARLGTALNAVATAYFGLLIFFLAFNVGPISAFLSHGSVKLLGEASYALYILQMPIFELLGWVCVLLVGHDDGVAYSCVLIGGIVAVSVLVHLGFEGPVRTFIRRRFGKATPGLRQSNQKQSIP